MIVGESIALYVYRQTAAGVASTGKVLADFIVAVNGATITPASFVELTTFGLWRIYSFVITAPSTVGPFSVAIDKASGTDFVWVPTGEIELNDIDSTANLVGTTIGGTSTNGTGTASDTDMGSVVMGDAWGTGTLQVSLARLANLGLTDLTGGTLTAAFKSAPADSPTTITATIVSAALGQVSASFVTFPAAMNLGSTETSKQWYFDIQFKHTASGKIYTVYRGSVQVVWQRDTTP